MYEKSKSVVFEKPRQVNVKEIALPAVNENSVVIKTVRSGISSGTEMKVYTGLSGALDGELWYPLIPGYEQAGEIVFLGKNVRHIKTCSGESLAVGDRVMANEVRKYPDYCAAWGGQVEYTVKDLTAVKDTMDMIAKIPDNVSYEEAVTSYLAGVAYKGIEKVNIQKNEKVLVIGMGNVGLSALQLAKMHTDTVIAMDIKDARLDFAKKYTDKIINPAREDAVEKLLSYTDNKKADVIIECSGNPDVIPGLPDFLRDGGWGQSDEGGRIHLQGDYPRPASFIPYQRWFVKNATVSMTCALRPGIKEKVLALISQKKFDARSLYNKVYNINDAPQAYKYLEKNRYDTLKILLEW